MSWIITIDGWLLIAALLGALIVGAILALLLLRASKHV
jgi:hypothetical protein